MHAVVSTANTATVQNLLTLSANSTGTAAIGFGAGILLQAEDDTSDDQDIASIEGVWTDATTASRDSAIVFKTESASGGLTERIRITGSASLTTISSLQDLYFSAGATNPITFTTSTGLVIGNSTSTGSAPTREELRFNSTYNNSSGAIAVSGIALDETFNLSGGITGTIRGIDINPTFTALDSAEYRAIDIQADNSAAYGIYQSGSSTQNYFEGETGIQNTAPAVALHVGDSSTTDGTNLIRTEDSNSTCNFTADAGSPTCGSDESLKKDIESLPDEELLEKVTDLRRYSIIGQPTRKIPC